MLISDLRVYDLALNLRVVMFDCPGIADCSHYPTYPS
jgi:hypothetical protein